MVGVENTQNEVIEGLVEGKGGKMFDYTLPGQKKATRSILRAWKKGKSIEIYGYSRGGKAAVNVSNTVGEQGVRVSKLVLFDAHILWDDYHHILMAENVSAAYNFFQKNERTGGQFGWWGSNPYHGSPVRSQFEGMYHLHKNLPGSNIKNFDFTGQNTIWGRPVSHNNIISHVLRNFQHLKL